jgi:hypothetical protein
MRAAGDQREVDRLLRLKDDDLKLLESITQHWLRHKFATEAGRQDLKAAMKQGGWRDTRSIVGYLIPDAEYQRQIVEKRGAPVAAAAEGSAAAVIAHSEVDAPTAIETAELANGSAGLSGTKVSQRGDQKSHNPFSGNKKPKPRALPW